MTSKEKVDKMDYWWNELKSLGIEPKRHNELNDDEELENLADIIKLSMYQDYKTAYIVWMVISMKKKHNQQSMSNS